MPTRIATAAAIALLPGQALQENGTPARSTLAIKDNLMKNLGINPDHFNALPDLDLDQINALNLNDEDLARMEFLNLYLYIIKDQDAN